MSMMGLEKFYGRQSVLDLLKKRVLDFKAGYRQNVALTGGRYIGKSFILHKFLSEVSAPDILQVYIDLEYKDAAYFCRKISGAILYEFCKIRQFPLHEDLNLLLESAQAHLPRTTGEIKKMQRYIRAGKNFEAFKAAIGLSQVFSSETGLFCLFIFDEFHCLEEWAIPETFQELGKTIMTQKQTLYIFASSSPDQAELILSEKLSLLFGNFEVISIGAFDLKVCRDYVAQHLPQLTMSETLSNFLIDFTGGHPLYLRLLCEELVQLAFIHQQKEIFFPLLLRAVENVVFDPWGVLSRHFDLILHHLCSGKGNAVNAALLVSLSEGKQRIKELAERMGIKQTGLGARVTRLQEKGFVAKNGKSFYICDRLLKYWLYYIFRPRREAIEMDPQHLRKQFAGEFARAVEDFRMNERKDISKRIIDLFHCFDDESFQMDGRRYQLPIFDQINPEDRALFSELSSGFDVIRASTTNGEWVVLLNADRVTEHGLASAMNEVRRRYGKPQRCVLIALNGLDDTVRVRALQERMWIWDERELRALLHIYDQPYIVVNS